MHPNLASLRWSTFRPCLCCLTWLDAGEGESISNLLERLEAYTNEYVHSLSSHEIREQS